ncbi:multiple sugar transport system substrate-binding protein [Enterococcus sp. AZ194]|uniref:ABC transporter substrate-binding protein n=1 Tax=Enterococcus sp. AZ194 TaxID=2774629 RepID=UPI003F27155D
MKKQMILCTVAFSALMLSLAGCGSGNDSKASDGKTKVTFWAAPNPPNLKYWQSMAEKYEKENKDVDVEVTQMKESPTSEATLQSAIASQTAPTLSENITRSFGAQLQESKALVDFTKVDGYDELVEKRNMSETIKSWEFSDGGQYVLPLSSSPIMIAWRKDILDELGFTEAPKTYSDVYEVGKKLKEKYPDKFIFANDGFADPTAWLRWLDFFPFYEAASKGAGFVEGKKYVADEGATKDVLSFANKLKEDKLVITEQLKDAFETGKAVATFFSPANLPGWNERFPELKYGETYYVTAPTVPDNMKDERDIYTFGNTKGVVMYAQATKEEQIAGMDFLKFVYGSADNDMELLKTTSSLPSRDDALTNEAFTNFYKENPVFEPFAEITPFGAPPMDSAKFNEIQTKIGEEAWIPAIQGKKEADKGWTDLTKSVEEILGNE